MTEKELFEAFICEYYPLTKSIAKEKGFSITDMHQAEWDAWQASAKRDGFVLAPLQPTDEMLRLGMIESYEYSADVWDAMLSAVEVQ